MSTSDSESLAEADADETVMALMTPPQNIAKLAKNIVKIITTGKSVTVERKNTVISLANEIMLLTTRIEADTGFDSTSIKSIVQGCIKEEITKLKSDLLKPSYAQMTKTALLIPPTIKTTEKPKHKPAIVVTAQTENKKETINAWRKTVSFRDTTFAPSKIIPLSNSKLRVEFETEEQRNTILKTVNEKGGNITAEPAKKLRPMIQLKGISKEVPAEELVDIIQKQNETLNKTEKTENDIVLRFQRKNKNDKLYNAVLMVTSPIWREIIKLGRINIDHQKIHAEEFSTHVQCFKCLQFGHNKNHCTSETQPCSYCAEKSHSFANCPHKKDQTKLKCHNCNAHNESHKLNRSTNHSATSNTCPIVQTMIHRATLKTDYGY